MILPCVQRDRERVRTPSGRAACHMGQESAAIQQCRAREGGRDHWQVWAPGDGHCEPIVKVNWRWCHGSAGDLHGATDVEYSKQDEVLERLIALAKRFKMNKVRCFDFWELDDVKPYRAAINERLG